MLGAERMRPNDVCTAILAGCQLLGVDRAKYMGLVKLLPCAVCGRGGPSDAHHCINGRYGQRRRDDFFTIPLCKLHHQGAEGIHKAQSRWESRFGPDTDYLQWTLDEVRRQLLLQGRI